MRRRRVVLALLLAAMLLPWWLVAPRPESAAAAQYYAITDLGPLAGHDATYGYAINAAGQVAGASFITSGGATRAVRWDGGHVAGLVGLPGTTASQGLGIAPDGAVLGAIGTASSPGYRAAVWRGGGIAVLGDLPGQFESEAVGQNRAGQVVGHSGRVATRWQAGVPVALGPLPGDADSQARAINDAGQIVGWSGGSAPRATLWQGDAPTALAPVAGRPLSQAWAINGSGQVAGSARSGEGLARAIRWQGGGYAELPPLPGDAGSSGYGINATGEVVGASASDIGVYRATIWRGTVASDLNAALPACSPWQLIVAQGSNDGGQVVGIGTRGGARHAFLLSPAASPPASECPRPAITALNPASARAGGGPFTLAILGANFLDSSVVRWNGAPRATTFVSSGELRVRVTGDDLRRAGTAQVTVATPGVQPSPPRAFTISAAPPPAPPPPPPPPPVVSDIYPATVPAGSEIVNLNVTGSNFAPGAVVRWNGSPRNTVRVSSTQLHATLTATDVLTPTTGAITVANPGYLPTSAPRSLVVVGPSRALLNTQKKLAAIDRAMLTLTKVTLGFLPGGGVAGCYLFDSTGGLGKPFWTCIAQGLPFVDVPFTIRDLWGAAGDVRTYADPPDSAYTVLADPAPPAVTHLVAGADDNGALADLVNALADNRAQQAGVAVAMVHAVERAQGAELAGDADWYARQQHRAGELASQLAGLEGREAELASAIAALVADEGLATVTLTPDDLASAQAWVRDQGLPPDMAQGLREAGADDATLALMQSLITAFDPALAPTLQETLATASAGSTALAAAPTLPLPGPSTPPASRATLTITPVQGGTTAGTAPGSYPSGQRVELTAIPAAGQLFLGWSVSGRAGAAIGTAPPVATWANPLVFTLAADTTVTPVFAPRPAFGDVPERTDGTINISAGPIAQLAARGVIRGCDPGGSPPSFCPDAITLRHQMAALIVRAMPGWAGETWPATFTDPTDDAELMGRVGVLQHYGAVGGYSAASCAAQGKFSPCYGPTDPVLRAQAISFVTRAMVKHGYWQDQPVNPQLYGGVLNGTGHEQDAATYWHYTRASGGVPTYPEDLTFPYDEQAPRDWFAVLLWTALDSYFGH